MSLRLVAVGQVPTAPAGGRRARSLRLVAVGQDPTARAVGAQAPIQPVISSRVIGLGRVTLIRHMEEQATERGAREGRACGLGAPRR